MRDRLLASRDINLHQSGGMRRRACAFLKAFERPVRE
jgi:hypothetical protein